MTVDTYASLRVHISVDRTADSMAKIVESYVYVKYVLYLTRIM